MQQQPDPQNKREGHKAAYISASAALVAAVIGYFAINPPFQKKDLHAEFTGQVLDADGPPIYNAEVLVELDQHAPERFFSDSDGIFHVEFPSGTRTMHVYVSKHGYVTQERELAPNRPGTEKFLLQKNGDVNGSGKVLTKPKIPEPTGASSPDAKKDTIPSPVQLGATAPAPSEPAVDSSRVKADQCVGFSPLSVESVSAYSVNSGYEASIRVHNSTGSDIRLFIADPNSIVNLGDAYTSGRTDLPIFGRGAPLEAGMLIPSKQSAAIILNFQRQQMGNSIKPAAVSFRLTLISGTHDGFNHVIFPRSAGTCEHVKLD